MERPKKKNSQLLFSIIGFFIGLLLAVGSKIVADSQASQTIGPNIGLGILFIAAIALMVVSGVLCVLLLIRQNR